MSSARLESKPQRPRQRGRAALYSAAAAAVLSAVALWGGAARAQERPEEPAAGPARTRIAVIVVAADQANEELADNLSEVLIAAVAEQAQAEIIGKEEFQAILQRQEVATLQCVESATCLGRIGAQLVVSEVIVGTLGQQGARYALDTSRIDVGTGSLINRVFRQIEGGLEELLRVVRETAPALYEVRVATGGLRVRCELEGAAAFLDDQLLGSLPITRPELPVGTYQLRVEADGYQPHSAEVEVAAGLMTDLAVELESIGRERTRSLGAALSAWSLLALGVGGLVAGVVLGVQSQEELPADPQLLRRTALELLDDREAEALAANVLFGVGGALALAGTLFLIFGRRLVFGTATSATPAVALTAGGTGMRWSF